MPAAKKAVAKKTVGKKTITPVKKTIAKKSTKAVAKKQSVVSKKPRGNDCVQCHKVYITPDKYGGMGAFAACDIKKGELIEKGVARRLPGLNGNVNPYVFTWSEDRTVWACGSGTAMFYNTSPIPEENNTHMERFFDEDRFEIHATQNIKKHQELRHMYRSLQWRGCFKNDPHLKKAAKK